ncbi:uncharacterized protein LOC129779153 [Toxorhynchites rutilus septentrionalis]|uniref:uncharacterized protein LOC129779153 n=1 Tax=Toxorhynchites rutilus septentrionalis TaxID=329112 RepID=UPI00247A2537|nr:uncharacterized protein LOC129779153 [Toxorhynchites rutilus septentrionalis]
MDPLRETILMDKFDSIQEKLINQIVTTYFVGVYTICRVLYRSKLSKNPTLNIQTSLPFVVVAQRQPDIWFNKPMAAAIELGCTVFVLDEEATLPFLENYITMHDDTIFRRPEKYIMIVLQSTAPKSEDLLKEIQTHPTILEVTNLLIIKPHGNAFDFITHRYVGNPPEALDFLRLDSFFPENDTFLEGNNLFPNKYDDLMGKTVKLASFHLLPWVMMRQVDDGIVRYLNQSHTIDGLDGYILIQFCLWYNCTWDLSVDQDYQYGQAFENRTGNGMIGALVERKVDFALAAVGGWYQLFKFFSFSTPVQWIGITCLAPRPKLIPSWTIIFLMFTRTVWIMILVAMIISALFEYLMPNEIGSWSTGPRSLSRSFITVFSTLLLLPASLRRSRASEVMFSVTLLMFSLVVGYGYLGKTHSIRAFPLFEPPIDTIHDLAISNLPWNAPHEAWIYALIGTENPYVQKILTTFRVPPIESLRAIANEGTEALIMAVLHYGHYMVGTWFTGENIENYRLMTEYVYFEYDTGYATKTWPLLDKFDYLAMWIRDASLYQYVEIVEVYRYMNYRVQISIEHSRDRQQSELLPLAVGDIGGGLVMLAFGYLVASVTFVVELITKSLERKTITKQIVQEWKAQVINSKRLTSIAERVANK